MNCVLGLVCFDQLSFQCLQGLYPFTRFCLTLPHVNLNSAVGGGGRQVASSAVCAKLTENVSFSS